MLQMLKWLHGLLKKFPAYAGQQPGPVYDFCISLKQKSGKIRLATFLFSQKNLVGICFYKL